MRIVRFDPEVSIPIDHFGSDFRIGRLIGDHARVRVQIMHLGVDGLIARHPAASRQLLAVVAGSGWVSGRHGRRRPIRAGYAACWERGEDHETGSEHGLTAVCVEGIFEVAALAVTHEIVVADYDPAWPAWFETLRSRIWPAVEDIAVRIDHVGSTSVPSLAAKPIIDMDIVVAEETDVRRAVERLRPFGYAWLGDLGVKGRQAFTIGGRNDLPPHHLYVVVEDNRAHLDHLLLRDLLRTDAAARERYADLKRANVELADGDMDLYLAAKAELVAELLTRARHERGLDPVTYWRPSLTAGEAGT